jgi:DNA-binding NarL/FixJ family response regulator
VVRILIAHAYEVVRTGLQRFIQSQPNWEIVAVASDGKEAFNRRWLPSHTSPLLIMCCH